MSIKEDGGTRVATPLISMVLTIHHHGLEVLKSGGIPSYDIYKFYSVNALSAQFAACPPPDSSCAVASGQ